MLTRSVSHLAFGKDDVSCLDMPTRHTRTSRGIEAPALLRRRGRDGMVRVGSCLDGRGNRSASSGQKADLAQPPKNSGSARKKLRQENRRLLRIPARETARRSAYAALIHFAAAR